MGQLVEIPDPLRLLLVIDGNPPIEKSETIGEATNNVAEYKALLLLLKTAQQQAVTSLEVRSDSELLVKQINGEYRVKNPDLLTLYNEAQDLIKGFEHFEIHHIRREQNKRTDQLCNEALDGDKTGKPKPVSCIKKSRVIGEVRAVSDARVREDCLECLQSAAQAWQRGESIPDVEMVWDQLWSILEEAGILKS